MADSPTLTPQQAASALADLAQFEESLSTRIGALTGMVWGLVSAAIFVSYGFAPTIKPDWVNGFLWMPWTVVGILLTTSLWKLHAISLRADPDSPRHRSWPWTLGFTALFLTAVLGLYVLDLEQAAFSYMLVVNGLVAFILVAVVSRRAGHLAATPMLPAGVLLVAGAFVLGALDLGATAMAFASAGLVGFAFVGAGLVGFVRG